MIRQPDKIARPARSRQLGHCHSHFRRDSRRRGSRHLGREPRYEVDVTRRWKELANQERTEQDFCFSYLLLSLPLPSLALTCPANVIVRDHRRGPSSDFCAVSDVIRQLRSASATRHPLSQPAMCPMGCRGEHFG